MAIEATWIDGEFGEEHIVVAGNNRLFQTEQDEPVLKHAASVFFADMVASDSSSSKGFGLSSNTATPFLTMSHWEDFPAVAQRDHPPPLKEIPIDLLDPLTPLPRTAMDGGAVKENPLNQGVSMNRPLISLYDSTLDELAWEGGTSIATANAVTHIQEIDNLHDPMSFDGGNDFSQLPPLAVSRCGSSGQAPAPRDDLLGLFYGGCQEAASSQLGGGDSALGMSGAGVNVQDKAAASEDGFLEPLYSRVRSQEDNEDGKDLEFGAFEKYGRDSDCLVLVSSIANLTKVLLARYGEREKRTSNAVEQAGMKALQSAIFDLSKCLLHAQERQQYDALQGMSEVEENRNTCEEDVKHDEDAMSQVEESNYTDDEDGKEEVLSRLEKLGMLLRRRGCHATSTQEAVDTESEDEQQEQQQSCLYLNSNQVEQRLALLRGRPDWNDDDEVSADKVAAKLADEEIDVKDDYTAEHKRQTTAADANEKQPPELFAKSCCKEVDGTGTRKLLDRTYESEDDSSWERV